MNLASYFFANMKLIDLMVEEVRTANPGIDDETLKQLELGFQGLETQQNSF
jgi:hypothetical protein